MINESTQNILLPPWALCQLFLFSYLKYHFVFLWLAQETPTQQKRCHLYSKMLKAASQNPIKIQRKATRSTRELLLNSTGTSEMTTSKYLILNSNKLNQQHGFKGNVIRPGQNSFFHTQQVCSQNCGERVHLALVELGRSSRVPSPAASMEPCSHPISSCATFTLAQTEQTQVLSHLLQCSSLQDKGGNPQALPVWFNFIPQNTFKELWCSQLSNHDSMEAGTQLHSWPAP